MTTTYLGGKTVAEAVPLSAAAAAQLAGLIGSQVARESALELQIVTPFVPPDPTSLAASLAAAVAGLAAALAALPAQVARGKLDAVASLAALKATLVPARELAARLTALASAGGVHAYAFDGAVSALGTELAAATSSGLPGGAGGYARGYALVLVTESPTAWAALSTILRTR